MKTLQAQLLFSFLLFDLDKLPKKGVNKMLYYTFEVMEFLSPLLGA